MTQTTRRLLLACLTLSLLALLALPTLADDVHAEEVRKVVLKILAGDELVELDLSELEIGESQQTYAADGTQIVATRTEDSYTIQVGDEEEIVVSTGGHGVHFNAGGGEGHQVIIRKHISEMTGDGSHSVFINSDGDALQIEVDEDSYQWISGDDDESAHAAMAHVIRMQTTDPAQRLIDSGVLDELDAATRQKILDELRKVESPHAGQTKVMIRKHHDDSEQQKIP